MIRHPLVIVVENCKVLAGYSAQAAPECLTSVAAEGIENSE
jgi:hypothetical protein